MPKKIQIPPGTVFGNWTVLEGDLIRDTCGKIKHPVRCSCGSLSYVQTSHLSQGRSTRCKECCSEYRAIGNIPGSFFNTIVSRAKKRGTVLTITLEDIEHQWSAQKGLCALTGWPLIMGVPKDSKKTASLDRIDSSLGYLSNNIQFVHKDVNKSKMDFPEPRFFEMCRAVAAHKEETKRLRRPWNKNKIDEA